jgi:hypothetical protein
MKKINILSLKFLLILFAMSIIVNSVSLLPLTQIKTAALVNQVKVVTHGAFIGANIGFEFDVDYTANVAGVVGYSKLANYVLINGKPIEAPYGSNLMSKWLGIWGSFNAGDTIEILPGMSFPKEVRTWPQPCQENDPAQDKTVTEGYKIVLSTSGTWVGESKLISIGRIINTETEEDIIFPARTKITIPFTVAISDDVMNGLENRAGISEKILFNGKTIAQINSLNSFVDFDGEEMPAIEVSSTGSDLDFYIRKEAITANGQKLFDGVYKTQLMIKAGFFGPDVNMGLMPISNDIGFTYYGKFDLWIGNVSNTVEKTTVLPQPTAELKATDIYGNTEIQIKFGSGNQIADSMTTFYNASPLSLVLQTAASRTISSIEKAATDGTYESLVNNLLVNGKSLKRWFAELSNASDEDKVFSNGDWNSNVYIMVHYYPTYIGVFLGAGSGMTDKSDISLALKEGLIFPNGKYIDRTYSFAKNTSVGPMDNKVVVSGLIILKPEKLVYKPNEELNLTGGKLTVLNSDGTETEVELSMNMITGYDKAKSGKQTLTVNYEGKTSTFDVSVTTSTSVTSATDESPDITPPNTDDSFNLLFYLLLVAFTGLIILKPKTSRI